MSKRGFALAQCRSTIGLWCTAQRPGYECCQSILRLSCLLFALLCSSLIQPSEAFAAPDCSSAASVTIASRYSPIFYTDFDVTFSGSSTESPASNYIGYAVTNSTGATIDDAWIKLDTFAGGSITLATNEDGIYHIGQMANGATKYVYFYLTASAETTTDQTHKATLYPGNPSTATATCEESFTITDVADLINAAANKVDAIFINPTTGELGGKAILTVEGATGTISSTQFMSFSPATRGNWRADLFELESIAFTFYSDATTRLVPISSFNDVLFLTGMGTTNKGYKIVYTFIPKQNTNATTPISPLVNVSSGMSNVKHTDIDQSTAGVFPTVPVVTNNVSFTSLTASPDTFTGMSASASVITVVVSNAGTTSVSLDQLKAIIPTGFAYDSSYTPQWAGSNIGAPSIAGSTLTWTSVFAVPAGSTATLTFRVTTPTTAGTYRFDSYGYISSTLIDSTASNTADLSPVSDYVTIGSTGSIGDLVWSDDDGNGSINGAEAGINGVTIDLYLDDGDGVFEPTTDDGPKLSTTTTAGGGLYSFGSLGAATYWVDVTDTGNQTSGKTLVSGTDPKKVILTAGTTFSTADFGYQADSCPADPLKTSPGQCGCGVADTDSDGDGTANCNDTCSSDPLKTAPGTCGCGTADTDTDGDGSADCIESCDLDPLKTAAGICGCGTSDVDSDGDGTADCSETCDSDPLKTAPGICGCGIADTDSDGDGSANCIEICDVDPLKTAPGICGCGTPDTDSDGDGLFNCQETCINDPLKTAPGICGCGTADTDSDSDGTANCLDTCPSDSGKTAPGICGCGVADTDSDGDGTANCVDACSADPLKTAVGQCGCGFPDTDADGDGTAVCLDSCDGDPLKTAAGQCGCGTPDTDTDGDGTAACLDSCDSDPAKLSAGQCGCGTPDTDTDGDGTAACLDSCDSDPVKLSAGQCGCGVPDTDSDGDGTAACFDSCDSDPSKLAPGQCGCGNADTDTDGDGTADCNDACINDASKIAAGQCGCGFPDTDADGDGIAICLDSCDGDPLKTAAGQCGCGTPDTDADGDGTAACLDSCDSDPAKLSAGQCGCGTPDTDVDGDGTAACLDSCDSDPAKLSAGQCGCGTPDTDTDGDGTAACLDSCDSDPAKLSAGQCGCGNAETDTDGDGTADCNDACINDASKTAVGQCGCGFPDTDADGDGTAACLDSCDGDPLKTAAGQCGCGTPDTDTDGDGTAACLDSCDNDPAKLSAGQCGCGTPDTDTDGDGTAACLDSCDSDPAKLAAGQCGCGVPDTDVDGDGAASCLDLCDNDPAKTALGQCGCGVADTDTDGDGTADCNDFCVNDANKLLAGQCGCGTPDIDTDGDGTAACLDSCDSDPAKLSAGQCGCGTPDTDVDGDGTAACLDSCDSDPAKLSPGQCGCGTPDTDTDGDGTAACTDSCDSDPAKLTGGQCGCGVPDTDTDGDGTAACLDSCDSDPAKIAAGQCGCGAAETDSDSDGTANCVDSCANDAAKTAPGICGCGVVDSNNDHDGDTVPDCVDLDNDNDGILDIVEQATSRNSGDTDGDGIVDVFDLDSDNDGIPDTIEAGAPDADGDGIIDNFVDVNGNGVADEVDSASTGTDLDPTDSDRDGIPDFQELDADADGIPDSIEGGVIGDADFDGIVDSSSDLDGDGFIDSVSPSASGTPATLPDTDRDGHPDFQDIDADNDGLLDSTECPSLACRDTDLDGVPDVHDLDSDNDGLTDTIEAGGIDDDADGRLDDQTDSDGDGLADVVDPDDDRTLTPNDGPGTPLPEPDTDGDSVKDYLDIDSDNDGITDIVESGTDDLDGDGRIDNFVDSDGDGYADSVDPDDDSTPGAGDGNGTPPPDLDSDSDGIPDRLELDSDDDGIFDIIEAGGEDLDTNGDGVIDNFVDTDGDGYDDEQAMHPFTPPDTDGDGVVDYQQPNFVLRGPFYFVWNGFLRQANVAALYNKSGTAVAQVKLSLLDLDGHVLSTRRLTLQPHAEFDFLVNEMPGFATNSYGLVKVEFTPAGTIDGYTGLYRLAPDGEEVEIDLLKEHQNSFTGTAYGTFNTCQPSRNPSELKNVVIHWLQLENLDRNFWRAFTVNRYDRNGQRIDSRRVSIPPEGRRDIQAGHEDVVQCRFGLVEIIPDDRQTQYAGELFRYGGDSVAGIFPSSFSFGIADKLDVGERKPQLVAVSRGADGENYLEITNLGSTATTARVEILSNFGATKLNTFLSLQPKQQVHLDLRSSLAEGEVGYARVSSSDQAQLLVRSTEYYHKPNGSISTAYSSFGRKPIVRDASSGHNEFFGQFNWLKLFNTSSSTTVVTIEVFRRDGSLIGKTYLTLRPRKGLDVELAQSFGFDLGTNTYGKLRVTSSVKNAVVMDALRLKPSADGTSVDLAKMLPLR